MRREFDGALELAARRLESPDTSLVFVERQGSYTLHHNSKRLTRDWPPEPVCEAQGQRSFANWQIDQPSRGVEQ